LEMLTLLEYVAKDVEAAVFSDDLCLS